MARRLHRLALIAFSWGCSAGGGSGDGADVTSGNLNPGALGPGGTPAATPGGFVLGPMFDPGEVEPTDECDGEIPVVYRDFSEAHPDFEMEFRGDVVRRQLVAPTLGADNKPVFASSIGCPAQQGTPTACADWDVEQPVITSAQTFDQWYRNTPGVNIPIEGVLSLVETSPGSGLYTYNSNDFFPIANDQGFGVTPANHFMNKNFLFTTEIHLTFQYVAGQRFSFRGDDDLWIFVNGRLALDLGSMHGAEQGTIDFDAQADELGITAGRAYPMDIFHAERHTDASNFGVETNIACFTPQVVY